METDNKKLETVPKQGIIKTSISNCFVGTLLSQLHDGNHGINIEKYESVANKLISNLNVTNISMYLQACISEIVEHMDENTLKNNVICIEMNDILRKHAREINMLNPIFRYGNSVFRVEEKVLDDEVVIKYVGKAIEDFPTFISNIGDLSETYPLFWRVPEYCYQYCGFRDIDDYAREEREELFSCRIYDICPSDETFDNILSIENMVEKLNAKSLNLINFPIPFNNEMLEESLLDRTIYSIGKYARLCIVASICSYTEKYIENLKFSINYNDILLKNINMLEELLLVFRVGKSWFRAYPNKELKRFDIYRLRTVFDTGQKVTWYTDLYDLVTPIAYELDGNGIDYEYESHIARKILRDKVLKEGDKDVIK